MARLAIILGTAAGYVAFVAAVCLVIVAAILVGRRLLHGAWFV
jgi:hypothetical protein